MIKKFLLTLIACSLSISLFAVAFEYQGEVSYNNHTYSLTLQNDRTLLENLMENSKLWDKNTGSFSYLYKWRSNPPELATYPTYMYGGGLVIIDSKGNVIKEGRIVDTIVLHKKYE